MAAMLAQFIPGMIVTYIKGGPQAASETSNTSKLKVKHPEKGGGTGAGAGAGEGQNRSSKRIFLVTGAGVKTARFGCIVKGPFHPKASSTAGGTAMTFASLSGNDSTLSLVEEMVMTLMIGPGDEVNLHPFYQPLQLLCSWSYLLVLCMCYFPPPSFTLLALPHLLTTFFSCLSIFLSPFLLLLSSFGQTLVLFKMVTVPCSSCCRVVPDDEVLYILQQTNYSVGRVSLHL
jgi:hypothetical protein